MLSKKIVSVILVLAIAIQSTGISVFAEDTRIDIPTIEEPSRDESIGEEAAEGESLLEESLEDEVEEEVIIEELDESKEYIVIEVLKDTFQG